MPFPAGVRGIRVDDTRITAGAVTIATGGFGNNREMLARYYPDAAAAESLWYVGSDHARGDGLRLGIAAGAELGGFNTGVLQLSTGLVRETTMMAEDTLRIADRIAIEDALCRYARGVDRKNWALFRSAYHDDAVDDHGDMKGTPDELVAAIEERHRTIAQSLHALHRTFIEFARPASAVVETSFTVVQSFGVEAAGRLRHADGHAACR